MKKKLIVLLFIILAGCYLLNNFAYSVPVLMYHTIDNNADKSRLSVTAESFDKQMNFLRKWGYHIMTLEQYGQMLKSNKKPAKRSVVVTFDDGFKSNYVEAYPTLKKYNIPAVIFVVVDWVGSKDMMSWDQIIELSQDPLIEIGAHTLNHDELTKMKPADASSQINLSKYILEEKIGKQVQFFCYPCGSFNDQIKQETEKAGYVLACATHPGGETPLDDLFAIRRLRISQSSDNLFVFWVQLSGYYTFFKDRKIKKKKHEENTCY